MLDVVHPAAKTLVDIARSQDAEASSVIVFVLFFLRCVFVDSVCFVKLIMIFGLK